MQNISLQLDTHEIHSSLNTTVTSLIEQITPELPHATFVTDLAFIMIIGAIVTLAFSDTGALRGVDGGRALHLCRGAPVRLHQAILRVRAQQL